MILGVDTGGTFTDFVLIHNNQLTVHKVLSTPAQPEQAILQGIKEMGLGQAVDKGKLLIIHGSTVATNAALENKGVKTAFITNRGFKDLLTIGRQTRKRLYDLQPPPVPPPVPGDLCLETGGRTAVDGTLTDPLSDADIESLIQQLSDLNPHSVAISFLFSFLDPTQEKRLEKSLKDLFYVSRSSRVLPIAGEYERGIATWLNASLGPLVNNYLNRLQQEVSPCHVAIMQSTGGTVEAHQAGQYAVNMLLSGPAGGLAGARKIGQLSHCSRLLTFDMGGTSTDVAIIDKEIRLTTEGAIGPWPIAAPMVDMHTIGAGGGSIARIDEGGILQVGPESAGASPGPACYGQGGSRPTVTDANAALGRLRPELFLGGTMTLDLAAARKALSTIAAPLGIAIEEAAQGIIDIANEHMTQALRVISVQRGFDINDFRLCCFGGAGGLHVCALAEALTMKRALVPIHGGVLSALGMLVAPRERMLSQSLTGTPDKMLVTKIDNTLATLQARGTRELLQEGAEPSAIRTTPSLDIRYKGQSFTLNIPWQQDILVAMDAFHKTHEQRYGHRLNTPVEPVNVRLHLTVPNGDVDLPENTGKPSSTNGKIAQATSYGSLYGISEPVAIFQRAGLKAREFVKGPALIAEKVSTTFISPGWTGSPDEYGNILLSQSPPN